MGKDSIDDQDELENDYLFLNEPTSLMYATSISLIE
jgi:hypothetical protein